MVNEKKTTEQILHDILYNGAEYSTKDISVLMDVTTQRANLIFNNLQKYSEIKMLYRSEIVQKRTYAVEFLKKK